MKYIYITFIFCISTCFASAVDKAPQPSFRDFDQIAGSHVYILVNHKRVRFLDITQANIVKLLGRPLNIKKEYSEVDNAKLPRYNYANGYIYFDKQGYIDDFVITKPGWSFIFYLNGTMGKPVTIGTGKADMKLYFPRSYKNIRDNSLGIWVKGADASITFEFKTGHVVEAGYHFNNS